MVNSSQKKKKQTGINLKLPCYQHLEIMEKHNKNFNGYLSLKEKKENPRWQEPGN